MVTHWLVVNFLHINDSKTEIFFTPSGKGVAVPLDVANLIFISYVVIKLSHAGFSLKVNSPINPFVRSVFFQSRWISNLKHILSRKHFESVIHAFITSLLDYSNSLLVGVYKVFLIHFQLFQNAAARFLTKADKRCHITPFLSQWH